MYPGVSPQAELQPGEEKVYHKYYMWVALVLACQTAMFMIPRYIWKSSEGGKIRMLIQGLMEPIIDDDTKADQIKLIVKYFRLNRGTHVSAGHRLKKVGPRFGELCTCCCLLLLPLIKCLNNSRNLGPLFYPSPE